MSMDSPPGGSPETRQAMGVFEQINLRPRDLRELFETCPLPLLLFHAESLRLLAANAAALNFYGYSSEEILARTIVELQPGSKLPALLQNLRSTGSGFTRHGAWLHQTKDGRALDVDMSWAPLLLNGDPCRLM